MDRAESGDSRTTAPDELAVEAALTMGFPRDRVWHAIVDGSARRAWWSYLDLHPTAGAQFEERWTDADGRPARTSGRVLEAVPGQLLRLSWRDDGWPEPTTVEIRLDGEAGETAVTVRHSGWERLERGAALAADHRDGWQMHLENLFAWLEERSGA